MTDRELLEEVYKNQRTIIWLLQMVTIFTTATFAAAAMNVALKIVMYVRQSKVANESLDILRLSRNVQTMTREQKDDVTHTMHEVKDAVHTIKQAVADGSQSGTRLPTVDPPFLQ